MRKTQREHVLCYLRVLRWLGQATPSCQVLLQQRQTRAGSRITLIGSPELETGMDDRVILTRLTAGSSSGQVIQDGLASWHRNQEAQAELQTRNNTRLTQKTGLHRTREGGSKKSEEEKGVAPSQKPAPRWCPRVLPRHKGTYYRRCDKRSWWIRRNNGTIGLTVYGP
jgi:hypothetical protein